MSISLGLDLGSNSIGWAIIELDEHRIIDSGVRIFHEGVNREKGQEIPKNAARREYRQSRRQHRRRKLRMKMLVKVLDDSNMIDINQDLTDWYRLNPYYLRKKGLDEKITIAEFARILFQFAKRRGFKSTRKGDAKETKIDVNDPESGRIGLNEHEKIFDDGFRTIGEYLFSLIRKDNESYELRQRVRNRVIKRQDYINEFNILWDNQSQYYPEFLNDKLKFEIGDPKKGILFFQREMLSQKKVVGSCKFEKNKARCAVSRIEFEEFRTWQFINNIQLNGEPIGDKLRYDFYSYISSKSSDTKISDLKKKFKLNEHKFNYDDDTKIPMHYTDYNISKLLEPDVIKSKSVDEIKEFKQKIWDTLVFAKEDAWLSNYAKEKWNFNDKQIQLLCKISLKDKYSSLSLKAINNILPFLRAGYNYYEAVILAGVYNAFENLWYELADEQLNIILNDIRLIIQSNNKIGETIERIQDYLKFNYNLSDKQLKKLYHPSEIEIEKSETNKLNLPENVRNPIVQKGLYELRKLVNKLTETYGKFDRINIELARDIKISKKQKIEILRNNKINESLNTEARIYIAKWGLAESRENIHKYLLYKELEKEGTAICPYSHLPISLTDLFDDNNIFQIEHIVPYSTSLDDSLANKTLCHWKVNQSKGDKTPFEYFGGDEERWNIIKNAVFKILPYKKARKFVNENKSEFEDFVAKQLNDTRYFSRYASEYLKQICDKVYPYAGGITAKLRHHWGLNSILNKEDDLKNREDNRHHAIDALVVAATEKKTLFRMSNSEKFKGSRKFLFPQPWEGFREDAEDSVSKILVSFENKNKIITPVIKRIKRKGKKFVTRGISVRGTLHAETVYGRRLSPYDGQYYYNVRVLIDAIDKEAKVRRIADPEIKRLVEDRLRLIGVNTEIKKYSVPKGAFTRINSDTGLKESLIFLHNKFGNPVPVNKVRLKNQSSNARVLHKDINQYVETSNNYLLAIYKDENGIYSESIITFWEAVERKRSNLEIAPNETQFGKLIHTFVKNDMFLLNLNDDEIDFDNPDYSKLFNNLYRVQKFSSMFYVFRKHNASTIDNDNEMVSIRSMKSLILVNPIKVKIDMLGRLSSV